MLNLLLFRFSDANIVVSLRASKQFRLFQTTLLRQSPVFATKERNPFIFSRKSLDCSVNLNVFTLHQKH